MKFRGRLRNYLEVIGVTGEVCGSRRKWIGGHWKSREVAAEVSKRIPRKSIEMCGSTLISSEVQLFRQCAAARLYEKWSQPQDEDDFGRELMCVDETG